MKDNEEEQAWLVYMVNSLCQPTMPRHSVMGILSSAIILPAQLRCQPHHDAARVTTFVTNYPLLTDVGRWVCSDVETAAGGNNGVGCWPPFCHLLLLPLPPTATVLVHITAAFPPRMG